MLENIPNLIKYHWLLQCLLTRHYLVNLFSWFICLNSLLLLDDGTLCFCTGFSFFGIIFVLFSTKLFVHQLIWHPFAKIQKPWMPSTNQLFWHWTFLTWNKCQCSHSISKWFISQLLSCVCIYLAVIAARFYIVTLHNFVNISFDGEEQTVVLRL